MALVSAVTRRGWDDKCEDLVGIFERICTERDFGLVDARFIDEAQENIQDAVDYVGYDRMHWLLTVAT
jgi:hypothetical protein